MAAYFTPLQVVLPHFSSSFDNLLIPQSSSVSLSPLSILFAGLLAQGSTDAERSGIWDHKIISKYEWDTILSKVKPYIQSRLIESLENAIKEETQENELRIIEDICWNSRGCTSTMATVSFLGSKNQKVLGVHCILTKSKMKNFNGSSRGMEREGTQVLSQWLKDNHVKPTHFLHDGNPKIMSVVNTAFPSCKEILCANHAAKHVGAWAYEHLSPGHLWRLKIQKAFKHACKTAGASDDEFRVRLAIMMEHYSGIHDSCKHTHNPTVNYQTLTNDQVNDLRKYLSNFVLQGELFVNGTNESLLEGWNKEINDFAPKHLYAPYLYECRVWLATLKHNEGTSFLMELYHQLSERVSLMLSSAPEQIKQIKQPNNRKSTETNLKKRKFTSYEPSDFSIKDLPTNIVRGCSCTKGCSTMRCSCKKAGGDCSNLCKCNSCANIHYNNNNHIIQSPPSPNKSTLQFLLN